MVKKLVKRIAGRVKKDNEKGARQSVLEDLFYDFNRSRVQVYKMNFFRGIFFGLGSALGATVIIALIVWLLSMLTDVPGGLGDFIQSIIDAMSRPRA